MVINILTIRVNILVALKVMMFFFFSYYRVLMANISEDMANEDLDSVKFLLSNTLPREKMEKAKVKVVCHHLLESIVVTY